MQFASASPVIDRAVLAALGQITPDCLPSAQRMIAQLGLSADQVHEVLPDLVREIEGRLPAFVNVLLLVSLLPILRQRIYRFHLDRNIPQPDAENLSQAAVLKILKALFGSWPRGNVGAWVAKIRDNVFRDDQRKRRRHARVMERLEQAFHALRR
jgi:hypothetical protein